MRGFFETVQALNAGGQNVAVTVLEGEYAGEKAVFSDKKLIWKSRETGFFSQYSDAVFENLKCSIEEKCGTRLFCDVLGQEKRLVICGGGHVSIPVIRIGTMMGWHVTVLEDRPKFADDARRAGADTVICMPFEEGLAQIKGSSETYFVILTRGHRYDQTCLGEIVKKEHAYIGMIGSRKRSAIVKANLIKSGCDKAVLEELASPIGMNIGAETPEEIGVSIMAEIIEVKNKKNRTGGYSKEILNMLLSEEEKDIRKVLVTIVGRRGSAPRSVGTKMLVLEDGRLIGTIGGGCVEAEVQRTALRMMHEEAAIKICHVDMSESDAEDEGMVCGGTIEVVLEVCGS